MTSEITQTPTISFEEIHTRGTELIRKRASFEILGLNGKMIDAVSLLEAEIEKQGLTCRIYTSGRIASIGASFLGGVTGVVGIASAAVIAAHNIATFNPDYEVSKHLVDNKLVVSYEK